MRKRNLIVMLAAVACLALAGCSSTKTSETTENTTTATQSGTSGQTTDTSAIKEKEVKVTDAITAKFTSFEVTSSYNEDKATKITLEDGKEVVIDKAGTYILSGTMKGQIVVKAAETDKIQLVLDGVDVTCEEGAALYVEEADKVVLTLAAGSKNVFTDKALPDEKINACICSRADLVINGTGSLEVNGNVNNGIGCKNDLEIISGNITVNAVKNGLKGNDSVSIVTGTITVNAGKDAIKSDNETDANKGYVYIENADLTLTAGDDGIQAVNAIVFKAGSYTAKCTGKKTNCDTLEDVADAVTVTDNGESTK